jgi:chorismate-pyruvate lyase
VPPTLWQFIHASCRLPLHALQFRPETELPEPARSLLAHSRDMTSTLADFHHSPLRVQIIQHVQQDDVYVREVFLRTLSVDAIVEYGVIVIALEQFTKPQRAAIRGGRAPLGGLLHFYRIPFVSTPVGFFAVTEAMLTLSRLAGVAHGTCYGRFNQLAKPTGEPLAWIMEILPPTAARQPSGISRAPSLDTPSASF